MCIPQQQKALETSLHLKEARLRGWGWTVSQRELQDVSRGPCGLIAVSGGCMTGSWRRHVC